MRLYSKKFPAKEAAKQFANRVKRHISISEICEKNSEDFEKSRFSQEWSRASSRISTSLEQKLKEPKSLLFFKGAIFVCTYNDEGKFSQS